jgi:glc operon protein GlcG
MRHARTLFATLLVTSSLALSALAQNLPNGYGAPIGVEAAQKAARAALAEGKKNGWTVAAAVVDAGGVLVYFERIDGTQSASSEVAQAKARSAAAFKRPTKAFEDALIGGRQAILSLPGAIPLDGGLPLLVGDKIVGAIGVSGATSQQDGVCAAAGVAALEGKAAPSKPVVKK